MESKTISLDVSHRITQTKQRIEKRNRTEKLVIVQESGQVIAQAERGAGSLKVINPVTATFPVPKVLFLKIQVNK